MSRTLNMLADRTTTPPTRLEEIKECPPMMETPDAQSAQWYALKVYFRRTQLLIDSCRLHGIDFFAPTEVIGSLLFVRCTEQQVWQLAESQAWRVWVYRTSDGRRAAPIADREMEVFRFVVTAGREGLELLGADRPEYHKGDRVRVTGGPFKGAEGHIKRIKRDRRLVVTVAGVVAVATTFIHPSMLEKVTDA